MGHPEDRTPTIDDVQLLWDALEDAYEDDKDAWAAAANAHSKVLTYFREQGLPTFPPMTRCA